LLEAKKEEEVLQLAETDEMPRWLRERKPGYGIWQRNNLWMLYNALALGGEHTTLLTLWNGEGGDGLVALETWWSKPGGWVRGLLSLIQRRSSDSDCRALG